MLANRMGHSMLGKLGNPIRQQAGSNRFVFGVVTVKTAFYWRSSRIPIKFEIRKPSIGEDR